MTGSILLDIAVAIFLLFGCSLVLIGAFGMLRMPDFYTRIHAAGITDTLATELILLGMMIEAGFSGSWLIVVKLMAIGFFMFFTSPTGTNAVVNAAWIAGLRPLVGRGLKPVERSDGLPMPPIRPDAPKTEEPD